MCKVDPEAGFQKSQEEEEIFECLDKCSNYGCNQEDEVAKNTGRSLHTVIHFRNSLNRIDRSSEKI